MISFSCCVHENATLRATEDTDDFSQVALHWKFEQNDNSLCQQCQKAMILPIWTSCFLDDTSKIFCNKKETKIFDFYSFYYFLQNTWCNIWACLTVTNESIIGCSHLLVKQRITLYKLYCRHCAHRHRNLQFPVFPQVSLSWHQMLTIIIRGFVILILSWLKCIC